MCIRGGMSKHSTQVSKVQRKKHPLQEKNTVEQSYHF